MFIFVLGVLGSIIPGASSIVLNLRVINSMIPRSSREGQTHLGYFMFLRVNRTATRAGTTFRVRMCGGSTEATLDLPNDRLESFASTL